MRFAPVDLALVGLLGANWALAQEAMPAVREPHHHTVYEDARARILDIRIEPRERMLLHRHDTDYIWVDDAGVHFSRGGMTHAERNHELIVELLQPQTDPRNVCAEILASEYLHCHEPGSEWIGADLEIQFETDQTRIGILRIAPTGTLAIPPADVPPLLIPLEGTEAEAISRLNGSSPASNSGRILQTVEVLRSPADHVTEVRNIGKTAARFLVVEFGGAGE
ncbi:MAG: hypothetical protein ACRD4E_17710 [Bryobacteraceae bacterium]